MEGQVGDVGRLENRPGGSGGQCVADSAVLMITSRELSNGQFPGTALKITLAWQQQQGMFMITVLPFQVRILFRFVRRRSIVYRWHDVAPNLFAAVPMLGAKNPISWLDRSRTWSLHIEFGKADGAFYRLLASSQSAQRFSAMGWWIRCCRVMEIFWHTCRKASTPKPQIESRVRPVSPRPWGVSYDDQDSCIPVSALFADGGCRLSKLSAVNKTH
ncbi:hypothetical protein QBC39DRAFT_29203 [Podospora conica]|nr:hypothetical protein QBC39DRAFT_29203 [Schizothecium conicum]